MTSNFVLLLEYKLPTLDCTRVPNIEQSEVNVQIKYSIVVVEPLVYFAFLFFNETVIIKTQGLVIRLARSSVLSVF